MGVVPFESFELKATLQAAPIQADWITGGTPTARNAVLSRSADRASYTMLWDCTAGSFQWQYDCDETVYILEGSILLSDGGNPVRRLGPGDAVFFPRGAVVNWEVEGYVRKLAFMRDTLPAPVSLGLKVMRKLRRIANEVIRRTGAMDRPRLAASGSPTATAA